SEHHAGQPNVLNVRGAARELPRNVAAAHALTDVVVLGGGFGLGRRGGLTLEERVGGQTPTRDLRTRRSCDRVVAHAQVRRGRAQLRRGRGQQNFTGLRAREAQRGAALLDGETAGRLALVRRAAGVAVDDGDALEIDVELVGGDLRQRGADAWPS